MPYRDWVNHFSTTRPGSWLARNLAARADPWLYRKTGGRFTSTGPPTIPQLVLTTRGRKSGEERSVQLAYLVDGSGFVVVASNFGGERHPAWSYNLLADPSARVDVDGKTVPVRAEQVSDDEREKLWSRLDEVIPQYEVYRKRTDRGIRVFRLTPVP